MTLVERRLGFLTLPPFPVLPHPGPPSLSLVTLTQSYLTLPLPNQAAAFGCPAGQRRWRGRRTELLGADGVQANSSPFLTRTRTLTLTLTLT